MPTVLPYLTWGFRVTTANQMIPFDRGGNLDATMRLGDYTAGQLATEAARAMNAADPGQAYTCAYDFGDRKFTFDNGATAFAIEWDRLTTTNAAGLFGFDDAPSASTADGHTSTDTVGTESSYFAGAGVYGWAPEDPVFATSPATAAADGTTATRLGRRIRAAQQDTEGGLRETIFYSEDKIYKIHFRYVTNTGSAPTEQTHLERWLDWIRTGAPFNFQPDVTSENAMRLVLANPGEIAGAFSFHTLDHVDMPELTFIQQLSRT